MTSSILHLGNHGNLLEDQRSNCRLIRLETPILTREDFDRILHVDMVGFSTRRFTASFGRNAGPHGSIQGARQPQRRVEKAVREGVNIIVLSDRVGRARCPCRRSSLGSVSHHLIECGLRMRADIVVETGDAMTPHDYACLVGYGASAIYPYLAHQLIRQLADDGHIKVDGEEGRGQLQQGPHGGHRLHHVEDGHLDDAGLSLRADLRGRGPCQGRRGPLLHRHAQPRRRPRHGRRPARVRGSLRREARPSAGARRPTSWRAPASPSGVRSAASSTC